MARKSKNTFDIPTIQDAVVAPIHVEQTADNTTYTRSRCGGALRLAREAQGLSVQDVASKLRLGPKQIEAIEADQFAKLPEPTIVRGFIRNYAKLLKMNAEPLLDAYIVIVPSNTQHELTVKPTTNMQVTSGDKAKPSSYIWIILAVLLALGVWLFYQNYIQKPSPTLPSMGVESLSNESLEPLPQPALPAAERTPESQSSIELTLPPATEAVLPSAPTGAPVDGAVPATAVPNPAPPAPAVAAPVISPPAAPIAAPISAGIAKLEFNATQETWVSVIDASGREVYSKTIFAGSRESIEVTTPANVTVGNAGATSLNMNGRAVDLAPHSRNNVAHVKLE
jgi:cytoskeleton protein RodZ